MGVIKNVEEIVNAFGQILGMIGVLSLAQWANVSTIMGAVVAVGVLFYTAR